jgi:hypothetical protein
MTRNSPKKLFDDLNRDILMPPGDGKIIILDDSDDKTETHEEKAADIEPTTLLLPPTRPQVLPLAPMMLLQG